MLFALLLVASSRYEGQIELLRQWKPNSLLTYEVSSSLQIESRDYRTSTFIPEDLDTKYQFTMQVGAVTPEGFATVTYKRPEIEVTEGETAESPPVKRSDEIKEHFILTMSPVNAITEMKDLTPKKDKKKDGVLQFLTRNERPQDAPMFMEFLGDFYRLALFVGSPETSMDFGPALSLFEVETGDEWSATASFQPQTLKGKKGKMAPQRLDYKYKYLGLVDSGDKKVHRVEAVLSLDTDIAPFLNDLMGATIAETHLRGFKLKLNTRVEYDLDTDTKNTIAARAVASGEMQILITDVIDSPYVEQRIKGRTRMRMVSMK